MGYVYFGEDSGARIVRYGVGYTQLDNDYVGEVQTWDLEPAGEVGDVVFRSVDCKVRHTLGYSITVEVYVDGTYLTEELFTSSPPSGTEAYALLQVPIAERGSRIRAVMEISDGYGEVEVVNISASGMPLRKVP
jgi:hypothetical protein